METSKIYPSDGAIVLDLQKRVLIKERALLLVIEKRRELGINEV